MIYIFPTDTVYGIGCSIDDETSIKKIFSIKKRDLNKSLIILCNNINQVKELVIDFPTNSKYVDYWPGALTIIFKKSKKVNNIISNKNTIGIRIPNHKTVNDLINKIGPIVCTSLNISGQDEILTYIEAKKFESHGTLLKGNDPTYNNSSTIIDVKGNIIRKGCIKFNK